MQPTQRGMYLEVDFGKPREVSAVFIESPVEPTIHLGLETEQRTGGWAALPSTETRKAEPVPASLRARATQELKRKGMGYVLVAPDDFGQDDFFANQKAWSFELVGEAQKNRLYRLL